MCVYIWASLDAYDEATQGAQEGISRKSQLRNGANCAFCERGCGLGIASTQSRRIPRESGLSGSATRFSLYSAHFGARHSRRRCHWQIHSLATGDGRSRSTRLGATKVWKTSSYLPRPINSEGKSQEEGSVLRVAKRESRNECRGRHQLLAQRGGGLLRTVILRRVFHGKIQHVAAYLLCQELKFVFLLLINYWM